MVEDAWRRGRLDCFGRWLARGLCRVDERSAQASRARLSDPGHAAPSVAGEARRAALDQGLDRCRPALPDDGLAPPASLAGQRRRSDTAEDEIYHLAALERQRRAVDQHGEIRGPASGSRDVGGTVRALQDRYGNLPR